MAKALEGQFFWEHTSGDEQMTSGDVYRIRVAQRKFTKEKSREEIVSDKKEDHLKRLRETIERERQRKISLLSISHHLKGDIRKFIYSLTEVVAEVHEIPVDILMSNLRSKKTMWAKHHYVWAFRRYFPRLTDSEVSRFLGKDRTSIYNSEKRFESMASEYADKINAVDIIMGYAKQ